MPKGWFDGGHGGTDPGALGCCGVPEKTVNLTVTKLVAAKLAPYMQIGFSRETDTTIDLHARGPMANNFGADFFVSIHCNSFSDPSANGIEVFHYPTDNEGKRLANEVITRLVPALGLRNRGVKTANFAVLVETKMPAILIEMGFLSNPQECGILTSVAGQEKAAEAIFEGILAYCGIEKQVQPAPVIGTNTIAPARATVEQAKEWAKNRGATATFINIASIFWKLAPATGVDPAVAYAQAAKETGFGRFGGVIDETYHNTCGLKVTAGGGNYDPNAHMRFSSWDVGVQAHIDHLALYAGAPGYPKSDSPDPRHFPYIAGKAPTVESLSGKWAPSPEYGPSIVNQYLKPMMETVAPVVVPPPIPIPTGPAYPDTKGHWIDGALRELKSMGWEDCLPDGLFHPGEKASRAEVASMIYKAIRILKK